VSADALSFLHRQIARNGPFQVEFRLSRQDDWPALLDHWFGSPRWRDSSHAFDLVGVDATGGLYCLWRYPQLADRPAPVVFLGSEGDGISVVAGDVAELVEILAQGYWWFAAIGRFTRDEENLVQPAFDAFAAAAASFIGRPLRSPESIAEVARESHPSFASFVAQLVETTGDIENGDMEE
jgi:hypothetical protein